MKIEAEITKTRFIFVLLFIFVLSGAFYVIAAYNGPIPNPGHGGDGVLINTSQGEMTLQEAFNRGIIGAKPNIEFEAVQYYKIYSYCPNGGRITDSQTCLTPQIENDCNCMNSGGDFCSRCTFVACDSVSGGWDRGVFRCTNEALPVDRCPENMTLVASSSGKFRCGFSNYILSRF